jgi:anti-anti-sigma regulatory factor
VGAAKELDATGRSLRLVTSDPGILRLLEITGVDTLIQVHPSLHEAR